MNVIVDELICIANDGWFQLKELVFLDELKFEFSLEKIPIFSIHVLNKIIHFMKKKIK